LQYFSNFSIPLGATVNQDGGVILSGVVMLFCAQAVGIHFGIGQIINCVVLTTLVCTGSTGLPGGGIMRLLVVATAMNLPLNVGAVWLNSILKLE
jgi:Na+/H+-dicarboxylate symporter